MGSNDPDTGDYVIESANSPNSASGQVLITTGANWAAEGSYYLMYEADYGGATTGQSTKFRLPPIDACKYRIYRLYVRSELTADEAEPCPV